VLFQKAEFPDLLADRTDLSSQQFAHVGTLFAFITLKYHTIQDFRQREPQFLRAPDEQNSLEATRPNTISN